MDGGGLAVMREKVRMDGFNASWSRFTSSQLLGFCWRESSAYMVLTCGVLPFCKGADSPGMIPEASGAASCMVPATCEGCCWMLPWATILQVLDFVES